jgi:hypothetical protein
VDPGRTCSEETRLSGVQLRATFRRAAHTRRGGAGIAVGLSAIGLALSAIGAGPAASASPIAPGQAVPAAAVARLNAIAASFTMNGGRRPAWESAVVTTHLRALESATPGDTTPDASTVVYLITMMGHFNAYGASVPAGARAPTGSYLSIVINARTYAIMDWGLSPKAPPVAPASLGPVTMLLR